MKTLRSESSHLLALFLSLAAFVASVPSIAQGTFVAPVAFSNVEGDAFSAYPFFHSNDPTGTRAQTVFGPSSLPLLPAQGIYLSAIRFRLDQRVNGSGIGKFNFVNITLSTTAKSLSEVTTQFDQNHGPNRTIVFDSGPTEIPISGFGPGPRAFTIEFTHDKLFFYKASDGNLVMDIRAQGTGFTDSIVVDYARDRGSITVFSPSTSPNPSIEFGAIVTEFEFSLVPEPTTCALAVFISASLIVCHSFRRKPNTDKRVQRGGAHFVQVFNNRTLSGTFLPVTIIDSSFHQGELTTDAELIYASL